MKSTEELIERLRGWHVGREVDLDEVANRLEELNKERAEMVAALRKAEAMHITAEEFSKWLAEPTEPDFVD